MQTPDKKLHFLGLVTLFILLAAPALQGNEVSVWEELLKPNHFAGVELRDGTGHVELEAPYRAEDAALTPIAVRLAAPQTAGRHVEKLWLFADGNPQPLVGVFNFALSVGAFEMATRIRIDQYTHVRAVVAFNTGEYFHVAKFVKAQGGCSAPLGSDLKAAMQNLGRMKFRQFPSASAAVLALSQLNISHPNVTGLQLNQKTRLIPPAHYVEKIKLSLNDRPILEADTGFSLSENPSIRFRFNSDAGDTLKAEVIDSKGLTFAREFEVGH